MNRADSTKALIRILNNHAFDRKKRVEAGGESPEFAAFSLSVYGRALADGAKELFGNVVSAEIYTETCYLVSEIDSHLEPKQSQIHENN